MSLQIDARAGIMPLGYVVNSWKKLLPPYVCILNHEKFPHTSELSPQGSSKDVETLRKSFGRLECEIEEVPNPTLATVKETIRKLALKSFVHLSALVIVILTQDDQSEKIVTCDNKGYLLYEDILFPLDQNDTLANKPKILIIQACKGVWESDSKRIKRNLPFCTKCYSSTERIDSNRILTDESIFIRTLCNRLDQDGLSKDIRSIIAYANANVEWHAKLLGWKQVPSITSILKLPFCFGDFVRLATDTSARTSPVAHFSSTSTTSAIPMIPPVSKEPGTTITIPQRKLQAPLVYILNHEIFINTSKNRTGSSIDVEALRSTFESLNCDVHEVQNPTLAAVQDTFKKLEKENLELRSALVIAILSHGDCNELIEACDDTAYYLNKDVLFPLFRNDTLRGKPKILIVQACKGSLQADSNPMRCNPGDYIICYGTTEGFEAYRHTSLGSLFIQTLCQHMNIFGKVKDFQTIIQGVNETVTKEAPKQLKKQMIPSFTSSLGEKKFYFWQNTYAEKVSIDRHLSEDISTLSLS
ncbi:caspase-1-like [Drosophila elegans]|uniref:caspase-1-like n=1 Tax=Drosophila elegans TaxID=30023 RepID=UPI001BC85078|nr:caspase-1-like [Drosophila elegans]XP_041563373.1 caspase-1-like [Drosophila elegans]